MNREQAKQSAQGTIDYHKRWKRDRKAIPTVSHFVEKDEAIKITKSKGFDTKFIVKNEDVVARCHDAGESGRRVGVLNFASATNPGGGYENGAQAQEESLCRNSFLGFELKRFFDVYYGPNREQKNGGLYTPAFIYSKDVLFIKREQGGVETFTNTPSLVDVITMAAPNQSMNKNGKIEQSVYTRDLAVKLQRVLRKFKAEGAEVLVLGAFGCGVFGNNPVTVAKIFDALFKTPEFAGAFHTVYFSIYGTGDNLNAFENTFGE